MKKVVRGYNRQFWRGVAATLVATYGMVLVLAVPTYAADGNVVSLTVDTKNVELKQSSSDLYKTTTKVTVDPAPLSGFDLTIHAKDTDLVNTSDSRYRIKGMDQAELLMGMNANSNLWGYRVEEGPGAEVMPEGFLHTPGDKEKPNVIVDTASEYDNAGCKDKKQCTVHVTFGASLDLTKLSAGKYSTEVTYTATAKPKPAPTVDPTTCKSGDPKNACQVDLDPNMIPVKYTGSTTNAQWTSVADPEAANSGWYDYANKQWANAVTVKKEAISKYRGFSKVVDQTDILGYWVYIPRYRYKVLRFSGSDPAVSAQNFTIEFENKQSTKATPTANGTWATHPAFTFGGKELNGIWFAKFETTGTTSQPTVLPNEMHISGYYSGINNQVGNFYSLSKTLGINDPNNVGGSGFTTTQNNHYLAKLSSHMVNNNDWGAATYLSASKYGAGYNGVQINSSAAKHTTYGDTYSITGCGPWKNGDTSSYGNSNDSWITHKGISVGSLGTQQACSTDDPQRAYNGSLGQLASTTNNPTGIYDMSGGGWEYVAASYSDNLNNSNTNEYFGSNTAHPPYVNTYNFKDFNSCTYQTCGGQALYETNNGTNDSAAQWNNNYAKFISASTPWLIRGGGYGNKSTAGLFYASSLNGKIFATHSLRAILAPTTQD